jgi:hypothetical protein
VPCLDTTQSTNSTKEIYRKASPEMAMPPRLNFSRDPDHLVARGNLRHPTIPHQVPNSRSAPRQVTFTELFEQISNE